MPTAEAGVTFVRGVCVDPTASTPSFFSDGVMAQLAKDVENWAPPAPAKPPTQSPPQAGLALVVRVVSTNSAGFENNLSLVVRIPAVPSLWAPPEPTASNYTELNAAHLAQQRLVQRLREEAAQKARDGAQALREFTLVRSYSAVTACASVLAVMVQGLSAEISGPQDTSFLIASDLADTQDRQLAGDFGQHPVVLLQPCPSGSLATCQRLADTFTAGLKRLGAGDVSVVRGELAESTVHGWLATQP